MSKFDHIDRFRHVGDRSEIEVEKSLDEDEEMMLLVALIGSETVYGYANETLFCQYVSEIASLYDDVDSGLHLDDSKENCLRCKVERDFCRCLTVIDNARALCGEMTLIQLARIVLSGENLFMERQSHIAMAMNRNKCSAGSVKQSSFPLIPISNIRARVAYWNLLSVPIKEIYINRIDTLLAAVKNYGTFCDIYLNT